MPYPASVSEGTVVSAGVRGAYTAERSLPLPLAGPTCAETKRVSVISPYPDRVHELVRRLSVLCYDVLLFHRYEPAVAGGLPLDLILLDAAALAADGGAETLPPSPGEEAGGPQFVWLLEEANEGLLPAVRPSQAETILCRGGLEEAVPAILELLLETPASSSLPGSAPAGQLVFKEVVVLPHKRAVTVKGRPVNLTKTEYELLVLLMEAKGAVLTREELLEKIWGSQLYGSSNVVDVHVRSLRKKLGDSASAPGIIGTVRGVGYRLADD
ncbi:hypothetical protein J31TS4_21310 [Paenibacillus sp. J31TS4]|uniref:winged helix-turn-helix domain-containing protein n=1 Tax=Paenibacillus sp. J31TS4 TaxID=2807195 RepID=UPI001B03653F|nr:winged helix-turn-helix domain-containing protein [Paenibacillus sp. J31TS4]GIP38851.1 hypothetical protein J31TS4_21310 [Paenibacillus sp. J31TS4]